MQALTHHILAINLLICNAFFHSVLHAYGVRTPYGVRTTVVGRALCVQIMGPTLRLHVTQ